MYYLNIFEKKIPCYFFYDINLGFYLICEATPSLGLKEKNYSLEIKGKNVFISKGDDLRLYKKNVGNLRTYVFVGKTCCYKVKYESLESEKKEEILDILSGLVSLPTGNYLIGSVQDYISVAEKLINADKMEYFFRGHYDYRYELIPSLYRKKEYRENENFMYMDFKTQFYNELSDKKYIEILTTMQHYKMPTRLLDTTSNPLVALFMACDKPQNFHGNSDIGEVVLMCEQIKDVKYSDSNGITILSSLAVLETHYKQEIYDCIIKSKKSNDPSIYKNSLAFKRFAAEVKSELPSFDLDFFNPEVLLKPRHVKVGMINERIIAQSGSFILFGLCDYNSFNFLRLNTVSSQRIFVINREKIIKQLEMLNIKSSTIYPDKDHMSIQITKNYS